MKDIVGYGKITTDGIGQFNDYIDLNTVGNRGKIGYDSNNVYIGSTASAGQIIFKNGITSTDPPQTSGSELMRIDSSGRVMIGTTTEGVPGADELTIGDTGAGHGITIRSASNSSGALFFSDGTSGGAEYDGGFEYNHSSQFMRIISAESERMRIDSEGDIFIGTTTDIAPTNGTNLYISDGTISRFGLEKTGSLSRKFSIGNGGTYLNIYDETRDAECFRIDSSGRISLGDLSGGVSGGPKLWVQTTRTTNYSPSDYNTWADLLVRNATNDSTCATGIAFITDAENYANGAGGIAAIAGSGDTEMELAFITRPNGIVATEAMRIDSSQRVGIGTTSPADKVDILGADDGLTIRSAVANRPKITLINGTTNMFSISANGTYAALGDGTDANRYMYFQDGVSRPTKLKPDKYAAEIFNTTITGTFVSGASQNTWHSITNVDFNNYLGGYLGEQKGVIVDIFWTSGNTSYGYNHNAQVTIPARSANTHSSYSGGSFSTFQIAGNFYTELPVTVAHHTSCTVTHNIRMRLRNSTGTSNDTMRISIYPKSTRNSNNPIITIWRS